jgi:hypothetical protein
MLSEREKWLMLQSWSRGRDEWDRWIADHEEHLAKEAPPPVQSQGSPPADCKCDLYRAKLARVAFVAKKYHEMEYYGDNSGMYALSVADEISEILSDDPEVLAVQRVKACKCCETPRPREKWKA